MIRIFPADAEFRGLVLITGFHGIGATGYWTVKFLIEHLEAERVALVDSEHIAPATTVSKGVLVTPYELYRVGELVFFKMEAPPYRGGEVLFFKEFSDWIIATGFREVVLVGGLDSSLKRDDTTFRMVHTRAYTPTGYLADAPILEDGHMIVGPVALMLTHFEMRNFPAYAILAYASTERVDPRAAASAVDVLSRQYGFRVDVTPLIRGAEIMEAELSRRASRVKADESMYT
jgi:uncharacterized protein